MANELKITFTGGSLLGEERDLSLDAPVLLGRSHSADIRLKEPDVSGRHLELLLGDDGPCAVCLSRHGFTLNGETVAEGGRRRLSPGDVVSLGSRARFRVDDISRGGAESDDASTTATRAFMSGDTVATQFARPGDLMGTGTVATHMGAATLPSDMDAAPRGSLEESPVTDSDTFSSISFPQAAKPAQAAAAIPAALTNAATDDSPTADDPGVPDAPFQAAMPDAPADFSIPADDAPTGADTGFSGGETMEMKTRQASMDEIFRMKRMLEAKKRFKRKLIGFAMLSLAALVATFVLVTWSRPEKELTQPFIAGTDKLDLAQFVLKSPSGGIDMVVDYPNDSRMKVSESQDGIEVTSYTGRDRDAPFRLSFIRRRDRRQYHLSLADSAEQEMDALAKKGYVFISERDDVHLDPESRAGFLFYEQETPQACQVKVQHGTRFFRREYRREEGGVQWHGMLTLLRDRDVVYRLLREVPDDLWPRASHLFHVDPNLTLYAGFLRRKWESPGDVALADVAVDEARLEHAVSEAQRGNTIDWPRISREIDALIVASAEASPDARKRADDLLARFRKCKDARYVEWVNEYNTARINGKKGEMRNAFEKCRGAFGSDSSDLRSQRVYDPQIFDPKEW